jgi:hypothetical protein
VVIVSAVLGNIDACVIVEPEDVVAAVFVIDTVLTQPGNPTIIPVNNINLTIVSVKCFI